MDDWGIDPDVALFVGGPKHCDIEAIGSTNLFRMTEAEDFYTFGAVGPQRIPTREYTYLRNEVYIPRDNVKLTVMYERSIHPSQVMQVAEAEWYFWQNWKNGGNWFNRPGFSYAFAGVAAKTPEEATAWLHNGTGKDFL